MDNLKGKQIEFSGASGNTRNGTILKNWTTKTGERWATVQAKPIFYWERPQDCIFAVALDVCNVNHNKCITHDTI